jgi:hypothetical protein
MMANRARYTTADVIQVLLESEDESLTGSGGLSASSTVSISSEASDTWSLSESDTSDYF